MIADTGSARPVRILGPDRHPLWEAPVPADVLAVHDAPFYLDVGVPALQRLLAGHGVTRVWELNGTRRDPEYEMAPDWCRFGAGLETYWSSPAVDWLVYVSHEQTIVFAGGWLVEAVKAAWPRWQEHVFAR